MDEICSHLITVFMTLILISNRWLFLSIKQRAVITITTIDEYVFLSLYEYIFSAIIRMNSFDYLCCWWKENIQSNLKKHIHVCLFSKLFIKRYTYVNVLMSIFHFLTRYRLPLIQPNLCICFICIWWCKFNQVFLWNDHLWPERI